MSFMKSSKQLNTAVWNKNMSFCERWRRWRAALFQPLPISNLINYLMQFLLQVIK